MLNVSIPRVKRALAQLGLLVLKNGAGHVLIPSCMYEQLALKLGAGPKVPGLSREEALVLAALYKRPVGVSSARAVSEAAKISPTSASRATC